MSDKLRVLFVCTANIARSPSMELLARAYAGDGLVVSSAGTHGLDGRPVDTRMAGELLARGVAAGEVAGFRSRPLTGALVADADLVLTATTEHRHHVRARWPEAPAPVLTLGQLATALGGTDAAGAELVRAVGARRLPDDPALDLADPYGRGDDAAADCAQQVESLLRVAVPPLVRSGRISA